MNLLLLPLVLAAEPSVDARAAMALALAASERKPVQHQTAGPSPAEEYGAARAESLRRGLPLVVWVNTPTCETFEGAIHCRVRQFAGVSGSGVVVGFPDGRGDLDRHDLLPGDCVAVRRLALTARASSQESGWSGHSNSASRSASPRFFPRFFRGSRGGGAAGCSGGS